MNADGTPIQRPERCFRYGCPNPTTERCTFQDEDHNQCLSMWCAEHRILVHGASFCPRHAGIARALAENPVEVRHPRLDVRAPALVVWVGDQLDSDIRLFLMAMGSEHDGNVLEVESIKRTESVGGHIRWERRWALVHEGQDIVGIGISVAEQHDAVVAVRVNNGVVLRRMAPWIRNRKIAEWVDPDLERVERANFYRGLLDVIIRTVNISRPFETRAS